MVTITLKTPDYKKSGNAFFWVNIGGSVAEVLKGEFPWAPQYGINKTGNMFKPAGWGNGQKVKEGDLIFATRVGG